MAGPAASVAWVAVRRLFLLTLAAAAALAAGQAVAAPVDTVPVDAGTPTGGEDVDLGEQVEQPVGEVVVPAAGQAPGDLVVIPAGCASAASAVAVFTGTLLTRSADSARFSIGQVRDGSLDEYRLGDLIDVRYGDDVRYLTDGDEYLIGVEAEGAVLASKVRAPAELFGGDAVIGINDSDVSCPRVEDPVMTLYADGDPVDVGVFTSMTGARGRVVRAVLLPVGLCLAALFVLAGIKLLGQTAFRAAMHSDPDNASRRRRRHSAQ